ncbi:hypothetical protein COO91_09003 [Nostoc flagelliforme CCNUN1]|uniref:Uncharacterized protein n=1 Tax=Nostoc flagelliforme CCNUN1 TaxID=2038116 RepID=A0A2K8T575_9NOSO|nr:hypothetical protein COO91_09003 [Nostoc flagelliforme CCNUN1]
MDTKALQGLYYRIDVQGREWGEINSKFKIQNSKLNKKTG